MSEVIAKAARVKRLLEDEDLQQAFADVRQAIINSWEDLPAGDKDLAHDLKISIDLLRAVRGNLERAVEDGELEEFARQQEQKITAIGR